MPEEVKHVQWQHMDKRRYYLYGTVFTVSVNMVLYPAELVTTRLQVQRTERVYKNTFHAVSKIVRTEGCRGLYKGFSVNQFSILTGQLYCTGYELSREQLSMFSLGTRGFLAGGAAALLEQCFLNPADVVAQRLMVQSRGKRRTSGVVKMASSVFRTHGLQGFYRGFMASLLVEGLSSAVWWASYGLYLDLLGNMAPCGTSHLAIQGVAGALSGASAAVIGNPLGIIRVRLQVEGKKSMSETLRELLKYEGAKALSKGMFASVLFIAPSSAISIIAYETVKNLSLNDDAKRMFYLQ